MAELRLHLEELEERIAPSLCVFITGTGETMTITTAADPNPLSPAGFNVVTANASVDVFPTLTLGPWNAHFASPVVGGPVCP